MGKPTSSSKKIALGVHLFRIRLKRVMFRAAGNFFFFQSFRISFDSSFEVERIISPSASMLPSFSDSFSP